MAVANAASRKVNVSGNIRASADVVVRQANVEIPQKDVINHRTPIEAPLRFWIRTQMVAGPVGSITTVVAGLSIEAGQVKAPKFFLFSQSFPRICEARKACIQIHIFHHRNRLKVDPAWLEVVTGDCIDWVLQRLTESRVGVFSRVCVIAGHRTKYAEAQQLS